MQRYTGTCTPSALIWRACAKSASAESYCFTQRLHATAVVEIDEAILRGVQPDGIAEFVVGLLEVPLAHEDDAAIVVRRAEIRAQLQARIVVCQGPLVVALVTVGNAARVEHRDIFRIDFERLVEGHDRTIVGASSTENRRCTNGQRPSACR